jgi:hypothetical protein
MLYDAYQVRHPKGTLLISTCATTPEASPNLVPPRGWPSRAPRDSLSPTVSNSALSLARRILSVRLDSGKDKRSSNSVNISDRTHDQISLVVGPVGREQSTSELRLSGHLQLRVEPTRFPEAYLGRITHRIRLWLEGGGMAFIETSD